MTRDDIIPHLEALQTRQASNKQVARDLGCSPETVSRVLKQLGIVKVPGLTKTRKANTKKLTQARYEFRKHAAKTMSIKQAMRATGLTERSVRRWRAK